MTSAPRSDKWCVQIGAATACSSATTRMPSRGSTIFLSPLTVARGKRRGAGLSKPDGGDDRYSAGDAGGSCENLAAGGGSITGEEVADLGSGLHQDGQSSGHVPEIDVQLDIGIDTTCGDLGEAQGAGAAKARHRTGRDNIIRQGQKLLPRATL